MTRADQRTWWNPALLAVLAAAVCFAPLSAAAKEPVQEFLEALRQRQYFDVAQDYLEGLKSRSDTPPETVAIIPFEQGRLLVDSARTLRDMPLRMKELDKAVEKFNDFLKASPTHALAASAKIQLGNVLVERGRALLETANKPSKVAEKETLLTQARTMFADAQKVFEAAEKEYEDRVNKYPKYIDPKEEKLIEERAQALADLIQARLFTATVMYELAKSYPSDTPDFKKHMQASADKYKEQFEKYRKRLAGLYAGMWQARCLQEMGSTKQALGIYDELLAQPDQPEEFRVMKSKTLRLALEAWLTPQEKQFEEATKRGEEWLKQARVDDERSPEGLGIRYFTAMAMDALVNRDAKDPKLADANKKRTTELVKHATFVAKLPGDYQQLSKELLSKYRDLGNQGPTNFAEARDAGKVALDAMQVADNKIRLAPVTKDEAKIPEFQKERLDARADAIKYYRLALQLRDKESSLDDVNVIRYFLTYLSYDAGDFYDAAVLGEFLARHYPKSAGARPGAKIAMAAYLQSYNAAHPDKRQFETGRMVSIANYITEAWPAEAESDEAWMILGDIAIREQNLTKAAEYLNKIPDTSPRRGDADLKAGQALWGAYLANSRLPEGERPPQAQLDQMAQQAQTTLERGTQRMRKEVSETNPVSYTLLASELSLAQIYIGSGQSDKAVALMELPTNGCLALVQAKSETVERGNFPEETYKAALRAYVGAQQMEKAEGMMSALDARVASKGGDEATLTRIYISLGRELGEQVEVLRQDISKATELQNVLKGFEAFLSRISTRTQGNTFSSLNWVGETFFNMAEKIDGGGALSAQAKVYYGHAATTYQGMLDRGKKEPAFLPSSGDSLTALEVRLAMCDRRLGKFKESIDRLTEILKKNPRMLEAQKQAAYCYQEWGAVDPRAYLAACNGNRPDPATGQNIIWGWGQMSVLLQRNPQYKESFHEARVNLAECRYRLAMTKSGAERNDELKKAEQAIIIIYKLSPTMGGEEYFRKYDRVLKTIQVALGQKNPAGLSGLQAPPASAAAGGTGTTTASAQK